MPTPNSLLIILNPNAAKGKARNHKRAIEAYFSSRDILQNGLNREALDAIQLVKGTLEGYKTIIVTGDGTLNEVVDGMTRNAGKGYLSWRGTRSGTNPIGHVTTSAFCGWNSQRGWASSALIAKGMALYRLRRALWGKFPEGRRYKRSGYWGWTQVNFLASDFKGLVEYLATSLPS